MYEFHGWFVVAETPEDHDDGGLDQILAELRQMLATMKWAPVRYDLYPLNGVYHLCVTGHLNRPLTHPEDVAALMTFLARRAPGSYGLLYWRDDEDASPPGMGEFRVRVLARGTITDRFDPFLSPTIPTIENG